MNNRMSCKFIPRKIKCKSKIVGSIDEDSQLSVTVRMGNYGYKKKV